MLSKRTNILFDEELWDTLARLARKKRISIGELVRDAVKKQYSEEERLEKKRKTVEEIVRFRERYGSQIGKGEDSVTIVRRMREQRTKHLMNLLKDK